MILEIQICTYGVDGLDRVSKMELPIVENVRYTVCFQNPENHKCDFPKELNRSDVRILEHSTKGLSVNRNFGLDNSQGDIILIADDDLKYSHDGLNYIINTFEKHPDIDFAAFKHIGGDNKHFPKCEFDFVGKDPRGYYLTSFELAIKRDSLPKEIRFSKNLGIGAPIFGAGEECVFLLRMKKHGLKGRFFPVVIAEHPNISTGNREASPAFLRAQGAWLWIRYGWIEGFLRLVRDIPRRNSDWSTSFKMLINGFVKAHKYFDREGKELQ